ncbi:MAG: glycosyltransferase family 2 protein [Methanomethylovorans sp.]|nr:glycosyltransferase family 2 protein [Methanomethylovorans sp.]
MTIVAVIPAYNEEVYLRDVIKKSRSYVDEIIVVDDCSNDATAFIASSMDVTLIRHDKPLGRAQALKNGFLEAYKFKPKIIVTIYPNGFHNPDEIPKLLEPIFWLQADVVTGEVKGHECMPVVLIDKNGKKQQTVVGETCDFSENRYAGFTAFSSNTFDVLQFDGTNAPVEYSLLKDVQDAGLDVKGVEVSIFVSDEHAIFYEYKIGVVIPAYNEEKLIKITVDGIPPYISRIFVINDASTDSTAQVLESIKDPRLYVITHEKNQGVGAAILHGYKRALMENMDITVVMGGDNQMNPDQLPKLLMPIIQGKADYTKGNRLLSKEFRGGMSKWRLFGNSILTMLNKISSGYWHIMDPQNGYTAISRRALSGIDIDTLFTYYGYCNDMLVKLNTFGFRTMDITMPARYGQEKSSIKYSKFMFRVSFMLFRKFLWRLKMKYVILSFHPLVFFYILGMILVPLGLLFGSYIFMGKLFYDWPVSPNSPLLVALLLITGIQFTLFAMLFDMQESDKCMQNNGTEYRSVVWN